MIKTTLKTILIFLFLFSSVSAQDCPKGAVGGTLPNGTLLCIPVHYEYDPFWWLKDPDPPSPREEILMSKLAEINPQPPPPRIIKDIQVPATMCLLAENLSPDLRKVFYLEINSTVKRIFPEELVVEFSRPSSDRQ